MDGMSAKSPPYAEADDTLNGVDPLEALTKFYLAWENFHRVCPTNDREVVEKAAQDLTDKANKVRALRVFYGC